MMNNSTISLNHNCFVILENFMAIDEKTFIPVTVFLKLLQAEWELSVYSYFEVSQTCFTWFMSKLELGLVEIIKEYLKPIPCDSLQVFLEGFSKM